MSLRSKVMSAAVAAALVGCAVPAAASAEPNVDAAVAAFKDLGLTPLTTMPSGRVVSPTVGSAENFGYRTYDQINQELANLASANPTLVTLKTARPLRSTCTEPITAPPRKNRTAPCGWSPVAVTVAVNWIAAPARTTGAELTRVVVVAVDSGRAGVLSGGVSVSCPAVPARTCSARRESDPTRPSGVD